MIREVGITKWQLDSVPQKVDIPHYGSGQSIANKAHHCHKHINLHGTLAGFKACLQRSDSEGVPIPTLLRDKALQGLETTATSKPDNRFREVCPLEAPAGLTQSDVLKDCRFRPIHSHAMPTLWRSKASPKPSHRVLGPLEAPPATERVGSSARSIKKFTSAADASDLLKQLTMTC